MPIVTRRQAAAAASASSSSDFAEVAKPTLAATAAAAPTTKRRSTGHALKNKDSNLLVDIAAPLGAAFPSPFKALSSGRRSLKGVSRATAASADKENEPTNEQDDASDQDESDRAWAELNKPTTLPAVVAMATPAKRTRRSQHVPATVGRISEHGVHDSFSDALDAPTPFKHMSGLPLHSLTPNPRSTRRSSARHSSGTASTIEPLDAASDFSFGASVIGDSFDEVNAALDAEEEFDLSRASIATHSMTPSSYSRTRSALTHHAAVPSRKADRRSLHHTQLQLLQQLVHGEESHEQMEPTEEEPELEQEQEIVSEEPQPEQLEQQLEEALPEQEQGPVMEKLPEVEAELVESPETEAASVCDDVLEHKEGSEPIAPLVQSTPAVVKTSRKSRKSRHSVAPASRKSLFESAACFTFHGVTPPATPLEPLPVAKSRKSAVGQLFIDEQLEDEITDAAQDSFASHTAVAPTPSKSAQRAITPRSNSRRKSFQQREEDDIVPASTNEPLFDSLEEYAPMPTTLLEAPMSGDEQCNNMFLDTSLGGLVANGTEEEEHSLIDPTISYLMDDASNGQQLDQQQDALIEDARLAQIAAATPLPLATPAKASAVAADDASDAGSEAATEILDEPTNTPRSLVRLVATDYTSSGAHIPDDILQKLFTRSKPMAGDAEEVKKTIEQQQPQGKPFRKATIEDNTVMMKAANQALVLAESTATPTPQVYDAPVEEIAVPLPKPVEIQKPAEIQSVESEVVEKVEELVVAASAAVVEVEPPTPEPEFGAPALVSSTRIGLFPTPKKRAAEVDAPIVAAPTPCRRPSFTRVPQLLASTPRTPARKRTLAPPVTPCTPFAVHAASLTPLTTAAFVERVRTSPRDLALYLAAFLIVLVALGFVW